MAGAAQVFHEDETVSLGLAVVECSVLAVEAGENGGVAVEVACGIVARATAQDVLPPPAFKFVVAVVAFEHVVAVGPEQAVATGATTQKVAAGIAFERVVAGATGHVFDAQQQVAGRVSGVARGIGERDRQTGGSGATVAGGVAA